MEVSVKKLIKCPVCERLGSEPWARVADVLLDEEKTRVVAVVALTESLIPLKRQLPIESIHERGGAFYAAHDESEGLEFPPPVSCVNEVFRLKSAGGSKILDIYFEPKRGGIVGALVGGLFDKIKIDIIQQTNQQKEMSEK